MNLQSSLVTLALCATASVACASPQWSFTLGVERRHDDNILQLTQSELDRFAIDPLSTRFRITSTDDDIMLYRGDVKCALQPLARRTTTARASVDASSFATNGFKGWEKYEVSVEQELTARRRSLTTARAWWNAEPNFYLREITDLDASFEAGRRIRRSLTYRQTSYGGRLTQQLARAHVSAAVGLERVHRDYNASFNERDNNNDQWRVDVDVRPFRRTGPEVGVTYEVGALHAEGDFASTEIRETDISYDHHGVGASIGVPWGRASWRGRLDASWMPERREYTTPDKFDVSRYQRVTRRTEWDVRATQHVWGPLDAVATYHRISTNASFPAGIEFDPDVTDFTQNVVGVGLRGRW